MKCVLKSSIIFVLGKFNLARTQVQNKTFLGTLSDASPPSTFTLISKIKFWKWEEDFRNAMNLYIKLFYWIKIYSKNGQPQVSNFEIMLFTFSLYIKLNDLFLYLDWTVQKMKIKRTWNESCKIIFNKVSLLYYFILSLIIKIIFRRFDSWNIQHKKFETDNQRMK